MEVICGIYAVVNLINNKKIIGSSNHIYKRWKYEHLWHLRNGKHKNPHWQASFNKYGEGFFELRILEICSEAKLIEREDYYISLYKTYDRNYGYNMQNATRTILREEVCKKISAAKMGHKTSAETKRKIGLGNRGKKQTKEAKRKIGLASSLRKFSPECLAKRRAKMLGRKMSKVSKSKMSKSGKKVWALKRKLGLDHWSSETIEKMRLARKLYWAKIKALEDDNEVQNQPE